MATYVYETIPTDAGKAPRRFEVQQSMKDAPLTRDPQTGEPVRRVISGGYGFVGTSKGNSPHVSAPARPSGGGCGHGSCGCGHSH